MIERTIDIATRDGATTTFICHPERGGPHPLIFFYMDAPGIREELRDMVRRLASIGYYVLLPNLYYRAGVLELGPYSGPNHGGARERMMGLMESLTIPLVMADTDALLAFAKSDTAASPGPAGAVGYCMSGQFAINAAARHPERFSAAASVYGVRLVTDAEVEIYPGVEHGFAFPQRAVYNRNAAERHWERLFSLFARRLRS